MKKIALIAAAALLSLAASAQDFKLGYVDFTELMQLMPEMDSARVQIDAASLEAQEKDHPPAETGKRVPTDFTSMFNATKQAYNSVYCKHTITKHASIHQTNRQACLKQSDIPCRTIRTIRKTYDLTIISLP